jgi:hypothetical protein
MFHIGVYDGLLNMLCLYASVHLQLCSILQGQQAHPRLTRLPPRQQPHRPHRHHLQQCRAHVGDAGDLTIRRAR